MINQQLLDYIRQQLAGGVSKEDTVKALLASNWSVQDVNEAFSILEKTLSTPVVPAPISPASAPTVAQSNVVSEGTLLKPPNITFFELLMYASIIVSIALPFLQYGQYITSQYFSISMLYVLLIPLALVIGRLVLVFLAAHRRMNWARMVLVALFLTHFMGLLGIVSAFFSNPILALSALAPILLEAAAFGFAFSRSANHWFDPTGLATNGPLSLGVENTTWSKGIPRTNIGFLIISLLLVFGLDLTILVGSPELAPFYIEMLVVLVIFGVFFYRENRILNKRFAHSRSTLDAWITTLVVIRNIVFVLNFIPLIQIGGAAALVFGGIPYLIIYSILLSKRSKIV
jgi:hypothetical protein